MPNKYLDSVQLGRLITKIKTHVSTTVADYMPLTGGSITGNLSVSGTITGNVTGDVTGDVTGTASGNLPLIGGALTGDLTISGKLLGSNSNNTATLFFVGNSRSEYDGYTGLYGANSYNNGASIFMYGKNNEAAGRFDIHAFDGTNRKTLFGNANGSLTWNGKEVERVNASGTNYIRFESGLQICWGYTTATTAGTTVTFPVAFANTNYSVVPQTGGSGLTAGFSSQTTTSVLIQSSHASVQAAIEYICIGKWK